MVFVTPVSRAAICWVLTAILTASSVGKASASSSELVCRLCVPPSMAARASKAVLATLLYGSWAVRETPAVWVWKRRRRDRSSLAPYFSLITVAQMRRAARNLAISSKKSMCELKKNENRGAKSRSEEHTSELQSRQYLVCRLLLEKK